MFRAAENVVYIVHLDVATVSLLSFIITNKKSETHFEIISILIKNIEHFYK